MALVRENINPEILTFSRERMGYAIPDIARKIPVGEERWLQWERGEAKPTTRQLVTLSNKLDRTPAFFYLDEIPSEAEPFSEFRTINNLPLESGPPKLITAIREARRNREELFTLYRSLNQDPKPTPRFELNELSIPQLAATVREWLGITYETQLSWTSSSNALTNWKTFLEDQDVYILQFPSVDVQTCRGFAIAEDRFPIVGINSRDSYNARIFTLIHELVHVLFRQSVLINDSLANYFGEEIDLEQTCNRLAAEILVPGALLKAGYTYDPTVREVQRLSNRYRVSGYVMLIRLKSEGLITQQEYSDLESEFVFYDGSSKDRDGGDPYYNRIVQKGKLFLKAAFQSYFDDRINVAELATLAGWKVPNLNELAAKTFGWPEEGRYI